MKRGAGTATISARFRQHAGGRGARLLFWSACTFAFVMATLPHPPQVPGEPNDKIQHIIAFITMALLGAWAYPRTTIIRLLIGLSVFGAIIEIVQAIPELHRDSDPLDWLADTLAAGVTLGLVSWWHRRGGVPVEGEVGAALAGRKAASSLSPKEDEQRGTHDSV